MASCLLEEIPDAGFQAILRYLSTDDHASLRQVCRSVCKRTTQHAPYIALRLGNSSSTEQLQQWFQATKRFSDVTHIHILVSGEVPGEVFNAAMQLLSQRSSSITELHLLGVAQSSCCSISSVVGEHQFSAAFIPTLKPLQHLLPHLQTLVIEGITVQDMASNLQDLAAAAADGGWQHLQHLTLNAAWGIYHTLQAANFIKGMSQLPATFPRLQQLTISIPTVGIRDTGPWVIASILDGSDVAADNEHMSHLEMFTCPHYQFAEVFQRAAATMTVTVAAVAVLANAVLQLTKLQTLTLTAMPDIWKPRLSVPGSEAVQSAAAVVGASEDVSINAGQGLLPSVSAAAAAFRTLDDFGSWLLQHHATLNKLEVSTTAAPAGWSATWHRSSIGGSDTCAVAQNDAAAAHCHITKCCMGNWTVDIVRGRMYHNSPAGDLAIVNGQILCSEFRQLLGYYSSQPAADAMRHISSCHLKLTHDEVIALSVLLGDFKSLKHLKVSITLLNAILESSYPLVVTAVTAAATLQGLQTLDISVIRGINALPDDLLLPLTAAAGGPGSSLTRLSLSGRFDGRFSNRENNCGWMHALKQLDGLLSLSILHHEEYTRLEGVLVDSLPASLQAFEGRGLHMIPTQAATAQRADTGASSSNMPAAAVAATGAVGVQPSRIHMLHLRDCKLSSPSILASGRLQHLDVDGTSWPGGWEAAAAAWPNVANLVWKIGNRHDSYNRSSSSSFSAHALPRQSAYMYADSLTANKPLVEQAFTDISTGFSCLTSMIVQELPWLSVETLQGIRQQMKYVRLSVSGQESSNANTSNSSVNQMTQMTESDLQAIRVWLQHELPWASVIVEQSRE